ncbi:PEP-CTERM sorting domain-containing protein [Alteromonas sp. ASW11-130]|uniref:PEP-CTERM sorting domain-containing protein n=1 Tax=Alteromonas sp. ASW11-130 TaxID=3015775 RepID=UPI003FA462F7
MLNGHFVPEPSTHLLMIASFLYVFSSIRRRTHLMSPPVKIKVVKRLSHSLLSVHPLVRSSFIKEIEPTVVAFLCLKYDSTTA